ncbi:zinc finger and BTB domain-containing protein 24 [Procambarus clarkii]|uniref:zinc finger and BTB domain-containing protein 24 n=1 Tax=Procambarus clarkii TaxID=6728 RepID=UPI001E675F0B|nr:zinc finger and BTB domain-containing protein 49-like [Procambarus clarkii]
MHATKMEEQQTVVIQVNNADWDQQTISNFEHLQVSNLATIECGAVQEVSNIGDVVSEEASPSEHHSELVKLDLEKLDNKSPKKNEVSMMKYECPYCLAKLKTKFSLNSHLKLHTGEKSFMCDICGDCFKTKGAADRHIRLHYHKKEYFCGLCGAEFASKFSCTKHMKSSHRVPASDVNMFRLKEEVLDEGENVLLIKVIRNGEAFKRRFRFVKGV